MYSNIQEYRDNLPFPPLPLPVGVVCTSISTSSSSSSASTSTSFSARRSSAVTVKMNGSKSPARNAAVRAQETSQLSSGAQEVVSSLLRRDPASRITADAILHTTWMVT
jgi:serine/threonine protein kinase